MHILLIRIDAEMKSERLVAPVETEGPYPLSIHVKEAGADAKLTQQAPRVHLPS